VDQDRHDPLDGEAASSQSVIFSDRLLAPVPVAPVNETDMVLFPEGLKALKQVAKEVGWT
jgi:hypothetical protein